MTMNFRSLNGFLLSLLVISVAVMVLVGTMVARAQPDGRQVMHFDGPTHLSIEDLDRNADLVVRATVRGLREQVVDFGSENKDEGGGGLPLALFDVEVTETILGERTPSSLLVALLDPELTVSESGVEISKGDDILLYLLRRDTAGSPAIRTVDGGEFFYIPLNFNNGVLRVDGGSVVTTGELPLAVTDAEAERIAEQQGEQERSGEPVVPRAGSRFGLDAVRGASQN